MAGFEIAEAFVTIRPELDDREFGKEVDRGVSKATDGAGGAATKGGKGIGKALIGGFAAAWAGGKALDIGGAILTTGAQLEQIKTKSKTVFGDALGIVDEWATGSARAMGITRSEATNLATSMGDLLIPMGFQRDEAAKMATETMNLSGALAEWSNGQFSAAEVGEKLTAAMLGEREGLKALGISISAEEVKRRAAIVAQQQMGTEYANLTDAQKQQVDALATQQLIMEKSTDAQTAYAEGAGSSARKQAELSATIAEMKEGLIQGLFPVLQTVVTFVVDNVIPAFQSFATFVGENKTTIMAVAGIITAIFLPALIQMGVQATISAAKQVAAWATTTAASSGAAIKSVAAIALQGAKWAWLGVQSLLHAAKVAAAWLIAMGPIAIVIAAVVGLVALIVLNWERIKEVIQKGWEFVKDLSERVWNAIVEFFETTLNALKDFFTDIWDGLKDMLSKAWSWIQEMAERIWDAIKAYFEFVFNFYKTLIENTWDAIKDFLDKAWDTIKRVAETVFNAIKDYFVRVFTFYKDLIERVWNGLKSFLDTLWTGIKRLAETLFNAIKAYFETVFGFYRTIIENTWNTIKGFLERLWNGIKAIAESIFNGLKGFFDRWMGAIRNMWSALRDFFASLWGGIRDTAANIFNAVKDRVVGAFSSMRDRVVGVWNDVTGRIKGFVNTIIGFINKVIRAWNGLSFTFPSRSFDWNGPLPGGNITVGGWTIGTPNLPTIPMLAKGGDIRRGGQAIVGEAGPELLNLPTGARVTPLDKAGGDTWHVTVQLSAKDIKEMADIQEFFHSIRQTARQRPAYGA